MRRFILGTDWWTDCDDAVALRLLARFVKEGRAALLGVAINACMEESAASLSGFLASEGLGGVPVGIDLSATDYGGNPPYQKRLAEELGRGISNRDLPDAVRLYRQLLADAEGEIEIIEIGFLQVLSAVLESGGDEISPLCGLELVKRKVKKIWIMAGKWDADGERENNFCRNARARLAGNRVCALCPVPVTFLGWEVGHGVLTGGELDRADRLYRILSDHGSEHGRHSWDPMLVLLALVGDEAAAGYDTVTGTASVDPDSGANHFLPNARGLHKFVVKTRDDAYYAREINRLLETP